MIRKNILLIFFIFLLPSIIFAQQHFSGGLGVGFTRSNITGMNGPININNMLKTGFTGGLVVAYSLDENNFLQMEINFTQKGCKVYDPYGYYPYDYFMASLSYFDVPVMYRFIRPSTEYNLLYVFDGGVSVGELFSSTLTQSIYGQNPYNFQSSYFRLRSFDVSVLGGFGFCFPNGIYAGQRLAYSVIPVVKRNKLPAGMRMLAIGKGHNIETQIFLQYCFGKEKMRVKGW